MTTACLQPSLAHQLNNLSSTKANDDANAAPPNITPIIHFTNRVSIPDISARN